VTDGGAIIAVLVVALAVGVIVGLAAKALVGFHGFRWRRRR
jgi:hypothetical protein